MDLVSQDHTAKQSAKVFLHQREQDFLHLIEHSPDMVARFNWELRHVYVNVAVEQSLGIPAQAIIGKTNRELGMPRTLTILWDDALQEVLATGQEKTIEFEFPSAAGTRFFQARIIPEQATDDTVESLLTVTRDITAQRQAEDFLALQVAQEKLLEAIAHSVRQQQDLTDILGLSVGELRSLLHTDRVMICQFQSNWTATVISEALLEDWSPMYGATITDPRLTPDYVDSFRQGNIEIIPDVQMADLPRSHLDLLHFFQVRANLGVPILPRGELWGLLLVQQCNGPYKWHPWEINLVRQIATQLAVAVQHGELQQQVCHLNETLGEQVQAQTVQLQQSLRFETLLKRITDKVRDSLDEAQILQAAVRELAVGLGVDSCDTRLYNPERTTSTIRYEYTTTLRPCQGLSFRVSEAPVPKLHEQLLRGEHCQFCFIFGAMRSQDRQFVRTKGRQVAVLVCPLFDGEEVVGDLWLYKEAHKQFNELEVRLVQQVTNQCAIALRQARLYEAAQQQVQELERLNSLKDDFLSTISHELRTPMANIRMSTQMVESIIRQASSLENATQEAERYFQILQDECDREINLIDDLLDLSRLDADSEPLMLIPINLQIWLPHIAEAFTERARSQQQELIIDIPDGLPDLVTDMSALARVLTELLTNACKYTLAQGYIRLAAQLTGKTLQIQVTNSVEIPAAELSRVFDKFYRIPNNDPWKYSGTGLGLALVKKLGAYINATIGVASGKGETTFTVTFPLDPTSNPTSK
jgi:PAS domain S-box-containing protein